MALDLSTVKRRLRLVLSLPKAYYRRLRPRPLKPCTKPQPSEPPQLSLIPRIAPERLEQAQSPFFNTLPGEIRMLIYQFALGGINHHLCRGTRVLRRLEFATPALNELYWPASNPHAAGYNPQLLALLLTCRKMHVPFPISNSHCQKNHFTDH